MALINPFVKNTRVKESRLVAFIILFLNIFGLNLFWHVPLCKRVVIELIWTVFNIVLHVFI